MRIVIAEENDSLASALGRALRQGGHAVDSFHDEGDADRTLDINLPRFDGLELLRNMRRRGDPDRASRRTLPDHGLDGDSTITC